MKGLRVEEKVVKIDLTPFSEALDKKIVEALGYACVELGFEQETETKLAVLTLKHLHDIPAKG